jgi:hypothetical protein
MQTGIATLGSMPFARRAFDDNAINAPIPAAGTMRDKQTPDCITLSLVPHCGQIMPLFARSNPNRS